MAEETTQIVAHDWVSFPGGQLEGRRPRVLCAACRDALKAAARGLARPADRKRAGATLCFQCYRANLDREQALRRAGSVYTGSAARFQEQLPFEAIDEARLARLKQERLSTRGELLQGTERFANRRREAQMAARRALQSIIAARPRGAASGVYDRTIAAAFHAAELQLPDSWMPFVVAR